MTLQIVIHKEYEGAFTVACEKNGSRILSKLSSDFSDYPGCFLFEVLLKDSTEAFHLGRRFAIAKSIYNKSKNN